MIGHLAFANIHDGILLSGIIYVLLLSLVLGHTVFFILYTITMTYLLPARCARCVFIGVGARGGPRARCPPASAVAGPPAWLAAGLACHSSIVGP